MLLLLLLPLPQRKKHPTDGESTISMIHFDGRPVIFNAYKILLTKSISALYNWKSDNYKKRKRKKEKGKQEQYNDDNDDNDYDTATTTVPKTTITTEEDYKTWRKEDAMGKRCAKQFRGLQRLLCEQYDAITIVSAMFLLPVLLLLLPRMKKLSMDEDVMVSMWMIWPVSCHIQYK